LKASWSCGTSEVVHASDGVNGVVEFADTCRQSRHRQQATATSAHHPRARTHPDHQLPDESSEFTALTLLCDVLPVVLTR
jgi:hypothetical protein